MYEGNNYIKQKRRLSFMVWVFLCASIASIVLHIYTDHSVLGGVAIWGIGLIVTPFILLVGCPRYPVFCFYLLPVVLWAASVVAYVCKRSRITVAFYVCATILWLLTTAFATNMILID